MNAIPVINQKTVEHDGRTYAVPVLTPLERFAYENGDRAPGILATELNRSEAAISAAYLRADKKVRELVALKTILCGVTFDGTIYRWVSNGAVPPADAIAERGIDQLPGFDAAKHDEVRDRELAEFLAEYRRQDPQPTAEQLAEMRAVFPPGTTVQNVITGRRTKL